MYKRLYEKPKNLMKGLVSIKAIDRETKKEQKVFSDEENIIVNSGGSTLLHNLLPRDKVDDHSRNNLVLDCIKIGNEVGNGSDTDPQPPSPDFSGSEQNVLLERELELFRKETDRIGFVVPLENDVVFDELGITEDREAVGFTSLTLWTRDGNLFAYKRFPIIYITLNIDFVIDWEIVWIPEEP